MAESVTRKVQREERLDRIMALAQGGATVRQIGKELGIHYATVARDIKSSLKASMASRPETEQYRELHRVRLERLLVTWWPRALDNASGLDRVLQILRRQAQLLGLDMPQQIDFTSPEGSKPDLSMLTDADVKALRVLLATTIESTTPREVRMLLAGATTKEPASAD